MAKALTQREMVSLIERINKDIKENVSNMSREEVRYLVDTYYQVQKFRIASQGQQRSINQNADTASNNYYALQFIGGNFEMIEKDIKRMLQVFVENQPIGRWLLSITGIGPVIAAGLIAHIDIKAVQTAGQIQAYAGYDPTKEWKKGEKRPWNARLKVLCWKAGQSFVKVSNNPSDVYGKIYKERKEYELKKNEKGEYADYAALQLKKKKYGKDTDAYKAYSAGKLPLAHIQARSERYAVKIFLSHLFTVWYQMENGKPAPRPYAEAILNHAHIIEPPSIESIQQFM